VQQDRMDLAIDQMLGRSRCAQCGGRLRLRKVMTKHEYVALIETQCVDCEANTKALCFDIEALRGIRREQEKPDTGETRPPLTSRSQSQRAKRAAESAPVSADDVLRIGDYLESFDGDFQRLFRRQAN
jgi:hypothetical protein